MLTEISQMQKEKYCMILLIWKINKHVDTEDRLMDTKGERNGGREKQVKGHRCMVTDGNKTFGGEHNAACTKAKI